MNKLRLILMVIICFSSSFAFALEFSVTASFNQRQSALIKELLAEIKKTALFDLLKKTHVEKIQLLPSKEKQEHFVSHVTGGRIYLSVALIDMALKGLELPENMKKRTRHPDTRTLLKAALIHELGHILDRNFVATNFQYVRSSHAEIVDHYSQPPEYRISTSKEFLDAFLWSYRISNGLIEKGNFLETRDLYPWEVESHSESFAANLEFYFLDPSYSLKQPSRSYFLDRLFGVSQNDNKKDFYFFQNNNWLEQPAIKKVDLDRVEDIHYFWAAEGKGMMSSFGHSMLRIVVCPEGSTPGQSGSKCRNNIRENLIVNFVAELADEQISTLKGLNGFYPLVTKVSNVSSVIGNYTSVEFRDIYSLPLNLKRDEIKRVLESIQVRNWSFEGRYYFLSRNCATEAIQTLSAAQLDTWNLKSVDTIKPNVFFDYLKSRSKTEKFENLKLSQEQGTYFPNNLPKFKKMIQILKEQNLLPKSVNTEDILKDKKWIVRAAELSLQNPDSDKASALVLLDYVIKKEKSRLLGMAMANQLHTGNKEFLKSAQEVRSAIYNFRNPFRSLSSSSYGIPTDLEISQLQVQLDEMNRDQAFVKENSVKQSWELLSLKDRNELDFMKSLRTLYRKLFEAYSSSKP